MGRQFEASEAPANSPGQEATKSDEAGQEARPDGLSREAREWPTASDEAEAEDEEEAKETLQEDRGQDREPSKPTKKRTRPAQRTEARSMSSNGNEAWAATEDEDEAREARADDRGQAEEPRKPPVEPSPSQLTRDA